jgi:hypothetical protein
MILKYYNETHLYNKDMLIRRAEQVLPRREGLGGEGWSGSQGEEMVQTMNAYMNK